MNLKWLDTYRYNQKSVFYYLDLVQELKERYNWRHILANPTEEALDNSQVDSFFDSCISVNFNELQRVGLDPFTDFIRKALYLFTILNHILTECKFNAERERTIDNFAKIFMS